MLHSDLTKTNEDIYKILDEVGLSLKQQQDIQKILNNYVIEAIDISPVKKHRPELDNDICVCLLERLDLKYNEITDEDIVELLNDWNI